MDEPTHYEVWDRDTANLVAYFHSKAKADELVGWYRAHGDFDLLIYEHHYPCEPGCDAP